jgi:hypothetical protein
MANVALDGDQEEAHVRNREARRRITNSSIPSNLAPTVPVASLLHGS